MLNLILPVSSYDEHRFSIVLHSLAIEHREAIENGQEGFEVQFYIPSNHENLSDICRKIGRFRLDYILPLTWKLYDSKLDPLPLALASSREDDYILGAESYYNVQDTLSRVIEESKTYEVILIGKEVAGSPKVLSQIGYKYGTSKFRQAVINLAIKTIDLTPGWHLVV